MERSAYPGLSSARARGLKCEHRARRAPRLALRPARRPHPPRHRAHRRLGGALRPLRAERRERPGARSPGRRVGRVRRADGRPLSLLPSALRGPDAQAAAPGGGGRLPGGDARQPQQPRARRRPGGERAGGGGGRPAARHVRAALPRPRPPDLERDDRQPRGAVGRARGPPRASASCTAPPRTTPTRACASCSA